MANHNIKQAIIVAGGSGQRLRPFTYATPKPLISINGKPFLLYLTEKLAEQGIKEVLVLTGFEPQKFNDVLDFANKGDMQVTAIATPPNFETGRRVFRIEEKIHDEFLYLYGDNFWPFNIEKMYQKYKKSNCLGQIVTYENNDFYSSSNIAINEDSLVTLYDQNRRSQEAKFIDLGFGIFNKEVLKFIDFNENKGFEKQVYPALVEMNSLAAFTTNHRYYTLTNIDRMGPLKQVLETKKVFFIDERAIISSEKFYGSNPVKLENFVLNDGVIDFFRKCRNENAEIFIVCFNSNISKGVLDQPVLDSIHQKIKMELQVHSCDVLRQVYICPHAEGENCQCATNKSGLFLRAQRDYHLDLSKAVYIGVSDSHIAVAKELDINCVKCHIDNQKISIPEVYVN